MKRFILFFALLVSVTLCNAQIVTIVNESFEGGLSGWTISPANYWVADTNLYAGGHTSYHGFVPIGNPGDTVILTSPLFDFGPYGYAFLSFNQICKVSGNDICQIEYRENTMSSTWQTIPRSSYKGSGIYTNAMFHDGSYIDWMPGDSLAIPTNNWWKTEQFDISNEVSYAEVQFRFKITKGSVIGTHFAYGWFIDNFHLIASVNQIASPVIEFITNFGDTVNNTGPFTINAKAASRTMAPMLTPTLYYSATYDNITINDSISMTAIDGDSIWTCNMPQFIFGSMIKYTIVASDSVGNIDSLNESFYIKNPAGVLDSNAVALLSVDNPTSGALGGEHAVKVTVKNKGINYLDSCYINWMINGVLQVPVVWRGHLPEDFNDTITIGYYTPRKNMYDTVDVWVSMPNGVIDTTTSDDAITSVFYKCYGPLSGDLIVGRGSDADASSIADVFTFVSLCGISGDISLKFQNGTYNENWNFSNLSNIMGNYTLTITSLSGNRDSVILKPISGVGVVLNNTNNLIIKDISIDNIGSVAYGVQFRGTARNIEFRNIHFIGNTTVKTSAGAPAPIYKASGTGVVDDIRFIGNLIDGGYYGIYFYGGTGSAAYGTNIIVDSNIITNQYYYSIYFYYNDFSSLSHNTILSRTANTYANWYGMYFNYCNLIANCNRVHQLSTSITSPTLTYFSYIGHYNTTKPSMFYNNEIIGYATSTYYAMSFARINKINIYHNSIYISGSDLTRCLNIANNTSSNYNIKNNIFVNGSNGYPIYFTGTTTPFSSDYNCFYATSKLGYFSGSKATLSAWQTATGQDLHSIVMNPSFIDVSSSLKLNHYTGLDCHRLSDISYDIEGTFRSLMTYMGCYSAPLVGANATLVEIYNLDNPAYQGDTSELKIVVLNSGLNTIQSATYNWSINNVLQPTVSWSGNITSKSYDTLTLGNIIYQSGYSEIVVWLTGLGTLTDGIPFDDSLRVSIYVCTDSISGNIVVGNAPGADFTSVNDVFYIANLCGVKGDINVKLQNGVYVENWNIIDLADQIGNHSLNITSLSGNKDSVIIRPTSGDVVVFNNSNNVNISHITIDAVNGNYAVNFTGRASNVLFENCNLYVNSTSTATTYGVIYKPSASGLLDGFTIRKCNINGGYYGVYIYGSESAYDYNITIDSNTFINQYYYGIYLYYVNSKSTSYNKITSRTANAGANWYGIWAMYHRKGGNIIGNRIFTDNASITSNLYGIRLYFIDTALVANNEIYFNSKANITNGIYFDYPVAVECIHNSVLLTGTSANSRPLYCWVYDSDDYDITIKNNNFVTTSSGFLPYAILLDGTYSSAYDYNYRIDYNNYYSSGNLAYVGGAKSDLASWQSTVTTDRNSVNVYPLFVDSLQNLKLINYSQLSCPRYEPINYDINHSNRLVRTAIGCYAPEIESVNGALVEVLNWKSMGYLGDSSQMKVVFFNFGSTNITSATIDWKFNNISQPSINWSGNLALGESDTIELGTVYYIKGSNELMVWINKLGSLRDTFLFDDTVIVSSLVCDSMLNGYYTIGSIGDFTNMDEAVDVLSLCGINGPVTFAIQPGIYYQNTTIGYINGSSPTNTITFISTTGDSSDVVLQRADDATSSLAPVMITDGENLIIKDLTLSGLGPVTPTRTFSHGIIINGNSRNIEVKNCHIFVPKNFPTAVTLQNHNPVRIMDTVSNVRIINNLIEGGSCGVYVYGVNPAARARNIVVKENTISEVDNYGFWMYYVDSILIEGNMIEQRTGNFSPGHFYGICAYYINCDILSNRIHAASLASAIYTNNLNSPSRLSLIANNEIIGTITGSSSYRGMNFTAPSCAKIYQNSMYLEGIDAIIGLSVENDAGTYVDIKNNNLVINSTGNAYPIYLAGTAYIGTQWFIDYNNYYNVNGVNIGYAGGARTSLVDWKNVVSTDIHSINTFPNFIDVNKNLELFDYSPFVVPSIPEVAYDIKYNQRTRLTTMGAYSVALYDGYDLALKTILSREEVKDIHCYGDFTNIQVVVKNEGSEKYNFNQDNVLFTVEVSGAINYKKDTLISLGNLLPAQSDTIEITNILPITTQGFYHIKTFLTSSLDTIYDDDTLSTVYGIHKIQLPYDIDFSTVPVEILQKQIVGKSSWAVEPDTGSTSEITPVFGTGRLTFHSESNPGSISQIIFNGINLIGINQPKLDFWYAHDNANSTKRDFVSIKISTNGVNSQLLDAFYRYDQTYTSPGWAHYTIDLSAYVNEPCVSLIFEGNSFGGGNQDIDRVRLSASSDDISLSYLSPLVSDLVSCNLTNLTAKVILTNLTGQNMDFDLDTCNIHFFISGMDSLYINYPLSGLLHGFEKDTITLSQTLDLSRNGVYDIIAYIDAIDNNSMNDTLKKRLLINPDLIIQDVAGIDEENCKRSGDSVYVSFKIVNMGNLTVNEFPLSLQINGVNVLNDTIYQHMEPGDYIQYAFAEPFVVPVVSDVQPYYFVKIQTELPCDAQPNNNIKDIMACVDVEEIIDLTILSIDQPLETPCEKGLYPAQVAITLSNQGNVDIEEATVYVEVDSAGTLHASFSETTEAIYARSILAYTFTQTYTVPNVEGAYKVKVFVDFTEGDTNALNDTLIIHPCAIFNDVSINETSAFNWTMGQNIPNPASAITRIPYSIPQEGVIHFTLTTITGQVLHSQDIPSAAGSHSMEFDTQHLAGGIYYYSMEYQGQRIIKKMTIQQ